MVRFATVTMDLGSDSVMSAELTYASQALSEGGRFLVQAVGVAVAPAFPYSSAQPPQLIVLFEVIEEEDDDNGQTH